jgi:hypothetical protein
MAAPRKCSEQFKDRAPGWRRPKGAIKRTADRGPRTS